MTEDLVAMLHDMGIEPGLDPARVLEAARSKALVGRRLQGKMTSAGLTGDLLPPVEV